MWNDVVVLFREYMGTGLIVIWYLLSLVYLFVKEKRKPLRVLFLYVPVILLLLYFNPLLAQIVYGVPAIKSVEFGIGAEVANLRGSQCNDAFTVANGNISTLTNNAGGILGGITNGMPVIFRAAIKPTPSISRPQQSVSLSKAQAQELVVKGRHDPCIVPRAVPVIEAAAAIALFDLILGNTQTDRRK